MGFFSNHGILGINARNLLYIRPYNKKKAIKLADDKIKTKQFLSTRDIPVPKLFGIIKNPAELEKFDFNALPNTFVLKPNHGFGGEGIIPIIDKKDDYYITASGKRISKEEIIDHIHDILDGRFSISNVGDTAFFEQYIISDDTVGKFSYGGLPDIRVVVHNLIPVMAMIRLPTKESEGKANLHLGAVGVGIDIAKGETTHIVHKNQIIYELPEGLGEIKGLKIPYWDDILLIASKVQLITNLGYMAIDICLDKNSGPVLLEINARAGLGVQIANLAPLRRRLERIEGVKVTNPTKGVRIAKDMFGNTVEKEIENLSGKPVIGTEETVELIQKDGVTLISAKIDTSKTRTIIDQEIAEKTGLLDQVDNYDDEKATLKIKLSLKGQRIQTIVDVEKIPSKEHKMIIGTRDLSNFLIETTIKQEENKTIPTPKASASKKEHNKAPNYRKMDQDLLHIDSKIKLLYHLKPTNLESEKAKFLANPGINPQFEYPQLKFDPLELTHSLEKIKTDNSPFGKILESKKKEILHKISLIESIDEERFSEISTKLFGKPSEQDLLNAKKLITEIDISKIKKQEATLTEEDAIRRFTEVFAKYGLKNWKAKVKESMVADCIAGKNNRLFIRKGAKFTKERIESLIVHEIETHIITAANGKMQPYEIFNRGLANYLQTQEGMAMWNVEQQRKHPFSQNYQALAHVIAIDSALKSSFSKTYARLTELGIPAQNAFKSCLKAKRGLADTSKPGAFTKDLVYYKGYYQVREFIENGGKLQDLYVGKMDISDVERAKEIPGVRDAMILPEWLK